MKKSEKSEKEVTPSRIELQDSKSKQDYPLGSLPSVNFSAKEKIYKKALVEWGEEAQIKMAVEELSELITALCKLSRKINGVDNITEEIADCEIMLDQLKFIFGNSDSVEDVKHIKLDRLEKLLKKEKT